ncbi:MAG TPA: NnrU family protein [Polyangiaceae bacterium]|nr:NnrU family protein [Polyangiaceae bacterium]
MRWLAFVYGLTAYALFGAVFVAYVPFLANLGPLRGIDQGPPTPLPLALVIDLSLLALFGVSHSVMARPWFKERWTRVVPVPLERSTYVLIASLILALVMWQWRALPAVLWDVQSEPARTLVWALAGAGIALLVASTFLIDHADLFGLRQVWLYARNRPYTPPPFRERWVYKLVRHPLMLGFLVWFWATPTLSVGRLVFALGLTVYIVIGVAFEERDLSRVLGASYQDYRRRVRAFLPLPRRR